MFFYILQWCSVPLRNTIVENLASARILPETDTAFQSTWKGKGKHENGGNGSNNNFFVADFSPDIPPVKSQGIDDG